MSSSRSSNVSSNKNVTANDHEAKYYNEPLQKNDGVSKQSSAPDKLPHDPTNTPECSWKSDTQPKDMSDYKYLKHTTGDGNMKHFMDMYNLRIWDEYDYAHAKDIVKTFKESDQEKYEEERGENENGKRH